jgi:fumarate reductase flavoprotein subunit
MLERSTDLVVVGGGLAGVSAALEAADRGLAVLLIEKTPSTGGSSAMSGGCLAFAGTDLQRAAGIEDGDELLFQDLREVGQFENDEAIVRAYVAHQKDTYKWLRGKGADFSPSLEASSGQSVPRVHTVDPADLVRLLEQLCRKTGRAELLTSTSVTRLLRPAPEGPVEGVVATRGGETLTIKARRGVVLASGGFSRNPELIRRFVPGYEKAIFNGGEGNVGDGLRMAWRLGADFRDMAYIKGTFGRHPVDTTNLHSCLAVYKGAIAVNQEGVRFVDESISYKLLGDAVLRQSYGSGYQILDQDVFEQGDNRVRILDFERRLEDGLMIKAETLEQLADMIEVPRPALLDTVAEYNRSVDRGDDPQFGRKHLVHKFGALRRLERPPFYAYPSTAAVFGTYCGLCVDPSMRVLDVFGSPIEGLLAAGEVVGGLHGAAYMTGSALAKAAIFGRIAARTAAERL